MTTKKSGQADEIKLDCDAMVNAAASIEPENELPIQQKAALDHLLRGHGITDAAKACGVTRQTVHNWLKKNARFQAAYNQWQMELKESCRARLLTLLDKATTALEKSLEAGNEKSAIVLLTRIGMLAKVPDRPTDEAEVQREAEIEGKRRKTEREVAEIRLRQELAAEKAAEKMWSEG